MGLCDRFKCLPRPGGLLDQDMSFIRMVKLYGPPRTAAARPQQEIEAQPY